MMMIKLFPLVIFFSIHSLSNQQESPAFESLIHLTNFGTQFQPQNSIELLQTVPNILSLLRCAMICNQNRQCRTFDYDQLSLICHLFEGEFSTGTVLTNSTSLTSRIGAILYDTTVNPQLYSSYNQSCDQCTATGNRYLQCVNGTCQCLQHTYWNGQKCANKLFNGSNCSSSMLSCREDFNLTCLSNTKVCGISQPKSSCYNISFQSPQLYTTGSNPETIIAADFNHDSHFDLAITNYLGNSITIFSGYGNGLFTPSPTTFPSNGNNPYWIIAQDFNKDGNLDLVYSNEHSNTFCIALGSSNGTFQTPPQAFPTGGNWPSSVAAADFDGDNTLDLVVANTDTNTMAMFRGLGDGTFQTPGILYSTGSQPSVIVTGDFNNDSAIDLALVTRGSNQLCIYLGLGNGNLSNNTFVYITDALPYSVRTGDFNGDSILDIVVACYYGNSINTFLGVGDGSFIRPSPGAYPAAGAGTFDATIGDLNGDLISDIAVTNPPSNVLTVFLGYKNGTFTNAIPVSSNGTRQQALVSKDFNEDGLDDIAVLNTNENTVAILLAVCPQN